MKLLIGIIIIWILLIQNVKAKDLLIGKNLNRAIEEGKEKWISLNSKKGGGAIWSECYRKAVNRMSKECPNMNNEDRTRMAIHIYNCQLIQSGHNQHECKESQSIASCLAHMRPEDNSYQTIVILTQTIENICFYIRSEKFQEALDKTIANLGKEATITASLLKGMGEVHGKLAKEMEETQKQQMQIFFQQENVIRTLKKVEVEEKQRHEALITNVGEVMQKSKTLGEEMGKIAEDQQVVLNNQGELLKQTEEGMKNLATSQEEMHMDISKQHQTIKKNHLEMHQQMNDLSKTHEDLNNQMGESLEKQMEIAKTQKLMHDFSKQIYQESEQMKHLVEQALSNQKTFFTTLLASQEALDTLKQGQKEAFERANQELSSLLATAEISSARVLELQESFSKENAKLLSILETLMDFASSSSNYSIQLQTLKFFCVSVLIIFLISHVAFVYQVRWYLYTCVVLESVIEHYILIPSTLLRPLAYVSRAFTFFAIFWISYQAYSGYINYERSTFELLSSLTQQGVPHQQEITPQKSIRSFAPVFTPECKKERDYSTYIDDSPSLKWKQLSLYDYPMLKRTNIDVAKGLF